MPLKEDAQKDAFQALDFTRSIQASCAGDSGDMSGSGDSADASQGRKTSDSSNLNIELTPRQQKIAQAAMLSLKRSPEIDSFKMALILGHSNHRSALNAWHSLRTQLGLTYTEGHKKRGPKAGTAAAKKAAIKEDKEEAKKKRKFSGNADDSEPEPEANIKAINGKKETHQPKKKRVSKAANESEDDDRKLASKVVKAEKGAEATTAPRTIRAADKAAAATGDGKPKMARGRAKKAKDEDKTPADDKAAVEDKAVIDDNNPADDKPVVDEDETELEPDLESELETEI